MWDRDSVTKLKSTNVLCVQWMAQFAYVLACVLPFLLMALTVFAYGESWINHVPESNWENCSHSWASHPPLASLLFRRWGSTFPSSSELLVSLPKIIFPPILGWVLTPHLFRSLLREVFPHAPFLNCLPTLTSPFPCLLFLRGSWFLALC